MDDLIPLTPQEQRDLRAAKPGIAGGLMIRPPTFEFSTFESKPPIRTVIPKRPIPVDDDHVPLDDEVPACCLYSATAFLAGNLTNEDLPPLLVYGFQESGLGELCNTATLYFSGLFSQWAYSPTGADPASIPVPVTTPPYFILVPIVYDGITGWGWYFGDAPVAGYDFGVPTDCLVGNGTFAFGGANAVIDMFSNTYTVAGVTVTRNTEGGCVAGTSPSDPGGLVVGGCVWTGTGWRLDFGHYAANKWSVYSSGNVYVKLETGGDNQSAPNQGTGTYTGTGPASPVIVA